MNSMTTTPIGRAKLLPRPLEQSGRERVGETLYRTVLWLLSSSCPCGRMGLEEDRPEVKEDEGGRRVRALRRD